MHDDNLIRRLAQTLPTLSAAEARVARVILEDPRKVVELTITELAHACGSSQASVARFAQSLGYSGYREFRIDLAAASSRDQVERERFSVGDGQIDAEDAIEDVVAKVAYQEALAIQETAKSIDFATLEACATALSRAQRIDIAGYGSSGLAASDLQQKLHRIGYPAHYFADPHMTLASVALQKPGNVTVGFSHSGLTLETIHAMEIAREAGATTIGVTNFPDSPFADACDLVLTTQARENRYRASATSSRIVQLAVTDFLFVRISQAGMAQMSEALRLSYDAVQRHRVAPGRQRNTTAR